MNFQILFATKEIKNINATKIVVVAFAMLCGFTGVIAGYFVLQGNVAPDGLIISTIGPEHRMWTTYSIYELMEPYSALTIIPNFSIDWNSFDYCKLSCYNMDSRIYP